MQNKITKEKIERIFRECDKHKLRILEATKDLENIMPLSKESYQNLDKDDIQALDQFLFRFSKLQDSIGRKLFKQILILKEDDVLFIESMSFRDILNILEKIGILEVSKWQNLRNIRNELAHNYDDVPEEMAEVLNKIYQQKETLFEVFENIKIYYKKLTQESFWDYQLMK